MRHACMRDLWISDMRERVKKIIPTICMPTFQTRSEMAKHREKIKIAGRA